MPPAFLGRLAGVAQDAWIERLLDVPGLERAVFAALATRFDSGAADGFEGRVTYELERPATGGATSRWTVQITGGRAVLRPDDIAQSAIRLRMRSPASCGWARGRSTRPRRCSRGAPTSKATWRWPSSSRRRSVL